MHNGSSRSPPQAIAFSVPPYLLSIEDIALQLGTDVDSGLTESEIAQRQSTYGPNAVLHFPSLPFPCLPVMLSLPPPASAHPVLDMSFVLVHRLTSS